jgi:hypothetical protein
LKPLDDRIADAGVSRNDRRGPYEIKRWYAVFDDKSCGESFSCTFPT